MSMALPIFVFLDNFSFCVLTKIVNFVCPYWV